MGGFNNPFDLFEQVLPSAFPLLPLPSQQLLSGAAGHPGYPTVVHPSKPPCRTPKHRRHSACS